MSNKLEKENEQLRLRVRQLEEQVALLEEKTGRKVQPLSQNHDDTKSSTKDDIKESVDNVNKNDNNNNNNNANNEKVDIFYKPKFLTKEQIARYGRQLILPEVSLQGQAKLTNGSVLIVGAGGLGAPAGFYLAAAGVGKIGFVDFDVVDKSNLHRQIIHTEHRVGVSKAYSAKLSCLSLNSDIQVEAYNEGFTEENGVSLVSKYDVVIDASDNVATRYLVNDACCIANKPLISGSALRFEGQLTVYNLGKNGPCYRCLYPEPPPAATVTNCSDGGVMGVVPGTIGCLQALEAQKILMGCGDVLSGRMLLFNALRGTFKVIRIRGRNSKCATNGDQPSITELKTYDKWLSTPCETKKPIKLNDQHCIDVNKYRSILETGTDHILLDVRSNVQFNICALPGAWNVPLDNLDKHLDEIKSRQKDGEKSRPIYVMCRRGISSKEATQKLLDCGLEKVININGGISAWAKDVDKGFPLY